MTAELIKELEVDIFTLPLADENCLAAQGAEITIGDLHGNAMKLLFLLVKHGIAKNLSEADYQQLVAIYKTGVNALSQQHLRDFNAILDKIEFNTAATVRLVGDELADRGNNDYYTLKILQKLHQHHVPVEILFSNHGVEFIEAYEKQGHFHAPMLQGWLARSLESLQILIDRGLVSRDELIKIADEAYKPTLRAIAYTLSEDKTSIVLFSHAGIGLNTIKHIAEHLGVAYADRTAIELAQTIDAINVVFQQHVKENTVHALYEHADMEKGYSGMSVDLTNAPFAMLIWNRCYDLIDRPAALSNGNSLAFVHGHDADDPTQDNIYNLDNALGKLERLNKGEYTVLYSKPEDVKIRAILKKIDVALSGLSNKIGKADQHQFPEACSQAITLLADLRLARNRYRQNLNNPQLAAEHAEKTFKEQCAAAIQVAKPILERDLGWGDYLINLLKTITSAVMGLVGANAFFTHTKSESSEAVNQLEQDLGPESM
ncbi:MAG: Dot/Icm T4SS effector Wip [Legionellales bacterium]